MPTYVYTPPSKDSLRANPSNSQKGVKYRIYNIFKPTIVLDELSLPKSTNSDSKKMEDVASMEYPLIKINNYFISQQELDFMNIDCRNFLPTITLQVTFLSDKFMDKEMPKDGDLISIAIRNKSDALNIIRNDYVITGVTPGRRAASGTRPVSVTFFGELFVPGLKSYIGSEAFKGTVLQVMKNVATELSLGFNTNDEDTNDSQIWLSVDSPEDFVYHLTSRAWKDENSFYDTWIDLYYNLNFVNIQKQLLSAEDDVDEGVSLDNIDAQWTWGAETEQNKTTAMPKVFSNYIGYRTTSFYITEWKPINKSSAMTFTYGTSMNASFFEHLNSLYKDPKSTKYWNFKISPAYDKEKLNSHILLRGRAKYDPSINEGELAKANYDYTNLYQRAPWMGIQYTAANTQEDNLEWTGNHHPNYLRSQIHNAINLAELEKVNVEINVQGANMNIIRGDKVPVAIIGMDPIENQLVNPEAQGRDRKNDFYSGWYMVKGYSLSWTKESIGSMLSNFSQSFILTRREWPTPIPTDPVPVQADNVQT